MRSRSQRWSAALLFLATISAALPVVRFCPLGWDEIDLATYATCSAMPAASACRPAAAARVEASPAPAGCGAVATCPMHARMASGAKCGSCPVERTSRPAPQPTAGGARRAPKHHAGPGWCFSEPLIAAATRAHAPVAPAPLAIAAAIVTLEVPATLRPLVPAADERPPAPPPLARPTIRGPPSLLG